MEQRIPSLARPQPTPSLPEERYEEPVESIEYLPSIPCFANGTYTDKSQSLGFEFCPPVLTSGKQYISEGFH
eukprot:scaffold204752_cov20-Prasinocladus_malaysianus.AAC.2